MAGIGRHGPVAEAVKASSQPLLDGDASRLEYPWPYYEDVYSRTPWYAPLAKLWKRQQAGFRHKQRTYSALDWLAFFVPCVRWMREYNPVTMLWQDVAAGISVGCMLMAQGLSYATLAGVPAVYGLYGAFLPCMAYALVGTSKQLAVGPVAVTSTLIGNHMHEILPCANDITNANQPVGADQIACQATYNHKVIQLAFIVACLYTGVGVLRLGWVTNFLSHAVISGFTSGAAIIIGLGQFKYVVGYNVKPPNDRLNLFLHDYFHLARNFKWQEFLMGGLLILMLASFKEIGRKAPVFRVLGPITAVVIGLLAVAVGGLDQYGIKVVGNIPKGLPKPTVDWWAPVENVGELIPIAVIVMLVDLLESTSIARALARKNGYELNYNLEIIGLGLANFAGAAFNAYTTTGSFSRSAVNDIAGSKSPLSQFICAWVVGFALLFLTPLFSHLPYNVIGAVIVTSVATLFDLEHAVYLFRVSKLDFLVWLSSFLGVLFASVEIGLGIAVAVALLLAIYQTAFPHTARLGRISGTNVYRNLKQYPESVVTPGILVFRIDAQLYFANYKTAQDKLLAAIKQADGLAKKNGLPSVQYVVLDMTPVHHVDAMGIHFLEDAVFEAQEHGYQLILANPQTRILHELEPVHFIELIGREWVFVTVHDAVSYCSARLAERGLAVAPVPVRDTNLTADLDTVSVSAGAGDESPKAAEVAMSTLKPGNP